MEELGGLIDGAVCLYLGSFDGNECNAVQAGESFKPGAACLLAELRALTGISGDEGLFMLAGTASPSPVLARSETATVGAAGMRQRTKRTNGRRFAGLRERDLSAHLTCHHYGGTLRGDEILLAHNRVSEEVSTVLSRALLNPARIWNSVWRVKSWRKWASR
jgi:hypothetical protein